MANFADIPVDVTAEQIEEMAKREVDTKVTKGSGNLITSGAVADMKITEDMLDRFYWGRLEALNINAYINLDILLDENYIPTPNNVISKVSFSGFFPDADKTGNEEYIAIPDSTANELYIKSLSSKKAFSYTRGSSKLTEIYYKIVEIRPQYGGDNMQSQLDELVNDNYIGYIFSGGAAYPAIFFNFYTPPEKGFKNEQYRIEIDKSDGRVWLSSREQRLDTDGQEEWSGWVNFNFGNLLSINVNSIEDLTEPNFYGDVVYLLSIPATLDNIIPMGKHLGYYTETFAEGRGFFLQSFPYNGTSGFFNLDELTYTPTNLIDLKYNPESGNAQSGLAVAEALADKVTTFNLEWDYIDDIQYILDAIREGNSPFNQPQFRGKNLRGIVNNINEGEVFIFENFYNGTTDCDYQRITFLPDTVYHSGETIMFIGSGQTGYDIQYEFAFDYKAITERVDNVENTLSSLKQCVKQVDFNSRDELNKYRFKENVVYTGWMRDITLSGNTVYIGTYVDSWFRFVALHESKTYTAAIGPGTFDTVSEKIEDTGGYFESGNVEGVLQEIGSTLNGLAEALEGLL